MNTSFWSHCQGLICRLKQRRPERRLRASASWAVESLEERAMLSAVPALLADIAPGIFSSQPSGLVTIGSTAYFSADDGVHGAELWKTDGTTAGTRMVTDINAGHAHPNHLFDVNGTLYFTANNGTHGTELWKSDGTAAGTVRVADINAGLANSYPGGFAQLNGTLYFAAEDAVHGRELWKTDGTASGTTMVADLFTGGSSNPEGLINVNGKLFFTANGDQDIPTLWVTDGTAAGTVQLSTTVTSPTQLRNLNGTLVFAGHNQQTGRELWSSDGTIAGTKLVKDIYTGHTEAFDYYGNSFIIANSSSPASMTVHNGKLYFSAKDATNGIELWKSDGTAAGTTLVKDVYPGLITIYDYASGGVITIPNSSVPKNITSHNGMLLFAADDGANGFELWKSDGTAAGTVLVKDINSGGGSSYFLPLASAGGTLYFRAHHDTYGYEVWKTDGTASGTSLVADTVPGVSSFFTWEATTLNDKLLLAASDGIRGVELWALNTAATPSLSVTGFPATVTAGTAGSFTVTVRNADGSVNKNFRGTIRFTSTDPQAVLPAQYTFTAADNGVRTFSATLKSAGIHAITATDIASASNTGSTGSVQVKAAAASVMTVNGFPASTTAGSPGNITVTLKDSYGNIATGYTGTVKFASSDAKAALPAMYTFTAADAGVRTFSVTLKMAGTQSISVVDYAQASLGATQTGISVKAGVAKQFQISAPSSVTAGVPFSLTLTVRDAYGNVVTGYTGTVRFTSTDTKATLPANFTFKASDNGVHTFTGIVLRTKGPRKITIADRLNSSLNASVTPNVR